jgi:hypothetical protein
VEQSAVTPSWRKSSYSGNGGGDCVEAAHVPGAVLIRDTRQHGTGPVLRVTAVGWSRLTSTIKANETLTG